MKKTRLVLVGGGHAHLEILRELTLHPRQDLDITLISTMQEHLYSGMVPGYLAGIYRRRDLSFDLPVVARRTGAAFVCQEAVRAEPETSEIVLGDGSRIGFDLASFNLGSLTAGADRETVKDHIRVAKPISKSSELIDGLDELAGASRTAPRNLVVVGAGAAGFEVSCAVSRRIRDAGGNLSICLVDGGSQILPQSGPKVRGLAEKVLRGYGIQLRLGQRVARVEESSVELESGESLPSHFTIWLTGPAAPPLFSRSGLQTDPKGFLLVDDSLRALSDVRMFGAGDCVTQANWPRTPKAGVYAVRQAPILWQALTATLNGGELPTYRPQQGFLSILNTCDGRALLDYKGFVSHSRWAWKLKDWIDRRFVKKYHDLET